MTTSSNNAAPLMRRITGIAALFAAALLVDPTRVLPPVTAFADLSQTTVLHALVIPALAAVGLWLVLPSVVVLAICVLMLAGARSDPGSADWFAGYLYPALAVLAALALAKTLLFTKPTTKPPETSP